MASALFDFVADVVLTRVFCFTGFTEEAEEAETDGTGVNKNKSEHLLLTFLFVASFFTVNVWQLVFALR